MEYRVVGIDVAKETLDIALSDGTLLNHKQFENTQKGHLQLETWLRNQEAANAHICMEATGQYGDRVAEHLYSQGFFVSVVNPARIKHYGNSKLRRNKTDKADAQLIAEYFRSGRRPRRPSRQRANGQSASLLLSIIKTLFLGCPPHPGI
jgi:transposase